MKNVKPVIFSCSGTVLTEAEKDFFRQENPLGFILFARNIENPDQVKALVSDFRQSVGRNDVPVLVDQEGGRVQRLRAPHWFEAPAFGKIGQLYELDPDDGIKACQLATRLIAADLRGLGINVDCSPCLDLSLAMTSNVIGDRSFHADPEIVALLGAVVTQEFMENGIIPVIKHIPGHGRGRVDSHIELPVVNASHGELAGADFIPFKKLALSPWGMTAHIVFENLDPVNPATQSAKIIEEVIRKELGFEGLLLTDDLNMEALAGSLSDRAKIALNAGVDIILHCSGKLVEMEEVASVCGVMSEKSIERYAASLSILTTPHTNNIDRETLKRELSLLLKRVA